MLSTGGVPSCREVRLVLAGQGPVLDLGLHVVAVHEGYEVQGDLLGAGLGALAVVGA